LKNTGNSPAVGVVLMPEIYLATNVRVDPVAEQRKKFDGLRGLPPNVLGYSIFAGATLPPEDMVLSIPRTEIDDALNRKYDMIFPTIIVCVDYNVPFEHDRRHHQTKAAFVLLGPDKVPWRTIFPGSGTIEMSQLRLQPVMLGMTVD